MADWLGKLTDIVSLTANSKAILGGAGSLALFSVAGVIPRVGFVRAFTLGFRSFIQPTYPLSVRKSEIKQLNDAILWMKKGSYIVVTGGKGNGKTCLIDTALNRHFGVVKISTKSGADKDLIIDQALRAITGIQLDFWKPVGSARRLLFFYSSLFKKPPIVVIRVPERLHDQPYADLPSAVRALADDFGLRVVVDSSPNSIPPELLATYRETVINVEPMSKEQIESISEFKVLIEFLKSRNLDNLVWKVLGGSPAKYLKLIEDLENKLLLLHPASHEAVDQVKKHLFSVLLSAFYMNVVKSSPMTKEIIKEFRKTNEAKISSADLEAIGLSLDFPNKVFREIKVVGNDYMFIEPSSPVLALIISENVRCDDDLHKLRDKLFENAEL